MSHAVRQLWSKAVKHGRQILQNFGKKQAGQVGEGGVAENVVRTERQIVSSAKPKSSFLEAISKRAVSTAAADLRRRAALRVSAPGQLTHGSRVSSLALVGFGLAAGSKLYGPVDQYGGNLACSQIKELFSELIEEGKQTGHVINDSNAIGVSDFQFGSLIGKGCNAAVYSAKYKQEQEDSEFDALMETDDDSSEDSFIVLGEGDLEDAKLETVSETTEKADSLEMEHDLAIKMIFNYEMESNAVSIMQGLGCEIVPAQHVSIDQTDNIWHNGTHVKKKKVKPHPNIVDMPNVFVDRVPDLPGAKENFPDALPERLNPEGCGRNSTLFLIMKRYQQTLNEYLKRTDISMETRTLLLTQLTEAVVYLSSTNIAHRDIKTDNILIEEVDGVPHLVLGDFGCCLSQQNESLYLAYPNNYVSKGGNGALMAPEIASAKPGFGVWLDYTKADLWAAGTVAYEILGEGNPFYRSSQNNTRLDSRTYQDKDLPNLPENIPNHLKKIVDLMTKRNPKQRASACVLANMLHVILWGPEDWLRAPPTETAVMEWLGLMAVECIVSKTDMSSVEYDLKTTFLSRVGFEDIIRAIYLLSS